jgi:hypothetical protein
MKSTFAVLSALAASALANPLVARAPDGCSADYSGTFEITVVNATTSKRDLSTRQTSGILTLTLAGGVLKDQAGRTGYIASNYQFQFDNPPQAGALETSGFSVCQNGSLALGDTAIWYQCLSGTFYNLYSKNWAPQCSPIYIDIIGGTSASVTEKSEGQPVATSQVVVSEKSEGQPVPTVLPVSQLTDGQPQGPISAPAPVSEKSEGQPVATSAAAVSEKSEGQPIASSSAAPVSQASEGQVQATGVSNGTYTTSTPAPYTGAAATPMAKLGALAAGLMGAVAML